MLRRVLGFLRKEIVLTISALCALVTMLFVLPDAQYAEYIDFRVLCLLFSLMAVVAGFRILGAFEFLTGFLLRHVKGGRALGAALVLMPFFVSMLVTNDVALLTFIPFTLLLFGQLQLSKALIPILVLETIAANLGSMATPVGNPQNLFLYSAYELSIGSFLKVVLPYAIVSGTLLALAAAFVMPKTLPPIQAKAAPLLSGFRMAVYAVLFVLCLLTVFRVFSYWLLAALVCAACLILNREILKQLDYCLLITFVCFFIVSGNLARVEAIQSLLNSLLSKNALLTSVLTSQVISNVPAAVLLSGFTDGWQALLAGVNIGGLGTPIASLASLITLKIYMRSENARTGRFLGIFTLYNGIGLIVLIALSAAL